MPSAAGRVLPASQPRLQHGKPEVNTCVLGSAMRGRNRFPDLGKATFQGWCQNCGIPATRSDDYRIWGLIGLEVWSSFGYLIVAGGLRRTDLGRAERVTGAGMAVRGVALLLAGLLLAGCVHTQVEPASDAAMTARDKKLLANAPYAKANIPVAYQRAIVRYHRKEAPGSIVVDSDARYLYYVLP